MDRRATGGAADAGAGRRLCRGARSLSPQDWEAARTGFENCLAIIPGDRPSKVFLSHIAQFHAAAPSADWDGVWSLAEK